MTVKGGHQTAESRARISATMRARTKRLAEQEAEIERLTAKIADLEDTLAQVKATGTWADVYRRSPEQVEEARRGHDLAAFLRQCRLPLTGI